ncbi:glycosyltransferase family 2 protein [Patescibacteria group bacterium]
MPKIAIIILNFNGKDYLADCLNSLTSLDYPQEDYQIFFIDNASTDDSVDYVKKNFPNLPISINKENFGFAQGNNIGMLKALELDYDYVFLINQDTITQKDTLNKLVAQTEANSSVAAAQPRIMLYPDKDKVNSLGNSIHYLGFGFSSGGYQEFNGDIKVKQVAYASGAAVLIKTSVLNKIGLFDPDFFMYHEDLDLGWRMRLAGYEIILVPAAVVYHAYEFSKSIKKYYFMERNRFICLLENYKWKTLTLITPACLVMELGLFVFAIKSGFALEKLKVYGYFLKPSSWSKTFKHRKAKKKYRKVKDKEIVRFFTGKIEFQEIDNFILKKIANPVFNLYWLIIKKLIIW